MLRENLGSHPASARGLAAAHNVQSSFEWGGLNPKPNDGPPKSKFGSGRRERDRPQELKPLPLFIAAASEDDVIFNTLGNPVEYWNVSIPTKE